MGLNARGMRALAYSITAENAAKVVTDTAGGAASVVADTAGGAATVVADTAGGATTAVVDTIGDAAGTVADTAGGVAGAVADTASGVASVVGDAAGGASSAVADTVGGAATAAMDTVGGAATAVIDGSAVNAMASAVKNTTDNVADVVRSVARPKEEETVVDEFAKFRATNTGSRGNMNFKVERNDIAKMSVGVVVLPANWKLLVGTGASMALFEAAGREELEAECALRFEEAKRKGQRLVPGVSILTRAYALPAKTIMHTIVPKWRDDDPRRCYEELCKSYASALALADEAGFKSIAFPGLASGNNGFDPDHAIDIAVESISRYQPKNLLSEAHLVTFNSGITQRMRDRGYQVEEAIDQMRVLDQDVHQAQVVKGSEH